MSKRICDIKSGYMFKLNRTGDVYIKVEHGDILTEAGVKAYLHALSGVTVVRKLAKWELRVLEEKRNAWQKPESSTHDQEIKQYRQAIAVLKDEVARLSVEADSLRRILYHIATTVLKEPRHEA